MPTLSRGLAAGLLLLVACFVALLTTGALACDVTGRASFYCCEHHGRETASGEIFNQNAMTAAMPNRSELGRSYRVSHAGRSVVVRITDTGGFAKYGRVIDLSRAAFARLADTDRGIINVCLERIR